MRSESGAMGDLQTTEDMRKKECELCGEVKSGARCHCGDCTELNGPKGRFLCSECANGIYE